MAEDNASVGIALHGLEVLHGCGDVTVFPVGDREFWGFMLRPGLQALVRHAVEAVVL